MRITHLTHFCRSTLKSFLPVVTLVKTLQPPPFLDSRVGTRWACAAPASCAVLQVFDSLFVVPGLRFLCESDAGLSAPALQSHNAPRNATELISRFESV